MQRTWKIAGIVAGVTVLLATFSFTLGYYRQRAKEQTVREGLAALMAKESVTAADVSKYLDAYLGDLSPETAAELVRAFEEVQQKTLPEWQELFDDPELQEAIRPHYHPGWTREEAGRIMDEETRTLLLSTFDQGFKIETAEGYFFPVIDYTSYARYRSAVTPDLAAYLDLMAVESEKPPVKDAALLIGWEEMIERALRQEEFLAAYPSSPQVEAVRRLLGRYRYFALFGCDNTPLFSYGTKVMRPEARQAYLAQEWDPQKGDFSALIEEYLAILAENDYRLTAEVEAFRKKAAGIE